MKASDPSAYPGGSRKLVIWFLSPVSHFHILEPSYYSLPRAYVCSHSWNVGGFFSRISFHIHHEGVSVLLPFKSPGREMPFSHITFRVILHRWPSGDQGRHSRLGPKLLYQLLLKMAAPWSQLAGLSTSFCISSLKRFGSNTLNLHREKRVFVRIC